MKLADKIAKIGEVADGMATAKQNVTDAEAAVTALINDAANAGFEDLIKAHAANEKAEA